MEEKVNYKFFKIYTEEDPLYYYEKYEAKTGNNEDKMPVTREFFTREEGIRNYSALEYLGRMAKLPTVERNLEGMVRTKFYVELEPHEFLAEVAPYLINDETREKKKGEVYSYLVRKKEGLIKGHIKLPIPPVEPPKEDKNTPAKEFLKRYIV